MPTRAELLLQEAGGTTADEKVVDERVTIA
jgi:hypothetical protein